MNKNTTIHDALKTFADAVKAKMTQITQGEREDQLRAPFENFMVSVANTLGWNVVCTGETPLPDRLGRPDYAVHLNKLLAGYVELKATGIGADAKTFKGHNRNQFKRFSGNPNILYTDGNEWALYRDGQLIDKIVKLSGDIASVGKKAVTSKEAHAIECLLRNFLMWKPIVPTDAKALAKLLAPLCKMLRQDVNEALSHGSKPIRHFAELWKKLLMANATDDRVADAYAQTVTFALLLAHSEGAHTLEEDLHDSVQKLAADHALLSRALQVLTDKSVRDEFKSSLSLLQRVIDRIPIKAMLGNGKSDPWLYFYEDFLTAYDPKLRKDAGAYYTPVEVVNAQVRLVDHLLVNKLNKPMGFANPGVITLDPAVGTGTYLLGVIKHAMDRVANEQGVGTVPGHATQLGQNIFGFEIMVGPYAVAQLRLSRDLLDRNATLPKDGPGIYLTDTLESPYLKSPQVVLGFAESELAEQHQRAINVKDATPVLVCLGNPPYWRHDALSKIGVERAGGWVRFDEEMTTDEPLEKREKRSILYPAFIKPAKDTGHGEDLKNLYNLYIYFWRWALWKVFEHKTHTGPGVVSFITASSYIDGDAFSGMREHMRRLCDDIWILDLGGEGRGTRKSDNVFAIQTPVAIAIVVRSKKVNIDKPAKVHYAQIKEGTHDDKLAILDTIDDFSSLQWQDCPEDWQAHFRPDGIGEYFDLPQFSDLFPWSGRGIQFSRTWPIAQDPGILKTRWESLLSSSGDKQKELLKETRDVRVDQSYQSFLSGTVLQRIDSLKKGDKPDKVERFVYRSYDRHWCIADRRLIDMPRPALWRSRSDKQVYMITIVNQALSDGQAIITSTSVPDLNAFRGSCGGLVYPLYRTADASEPNIPPKLLDLLSSTYYKRKQVTPEDFLAYIYGVLAQPAFTARFAKELETRELRVPITKDSSLFEKVRDTGARLLWLHTYGERFVPKGKKYGHIPHGSAKCTKAIPGNVEGFPESFNYNKVTKTLHVGSGEFTTVEPEIFNFEVSGLKVVQSWLGYRMKHGKGKKSSPLDDIRPECWTSQFTTELLELLWVLEATIRGYPEQAKLLEDIIDGDCFQADEFPKVPEKMRKPPSIRQTGKNLFDSIE